ncbi:hypothetical protein [Paenibacillus thalictri]|uniref:Periplasmic protein n=1 Tax=Paenibacillus thalictri TaxID=2527873 RepID=A0A4Q9DVV8_9BACL|nr:hypothetical protein [Paenibacillus thalictri]TBL81194.1 hypothetical protein EYB31_03635 [Paenibacillus thalictri]
MRYKMMNRWNVYEPFYIHFNGMSIADIVITDHAKLRWTERIDRKQDGIEHICSYLWHHLRNSTIEAYHEKEKDVYLIEGDMVMVAEFFEMNDEFDLSGNPLYKMVVITFLGKLSTDIGLRDLKTYYSWLRHSRRMTLMKHGRKRR